MQSYYLGKDHVSVQVTINVSAGMSFLSHVYTHVVTAEVLNMLLYYARHTNNGQIIYFRQLDLRRVNPIPSFHCHVVQINVCNDMCLL